MEGKKILKEVWYWASRISLVFGILMIPMPIAILVGLTSGWDYAWCGYIFGLWLMFELYFLVMLRRENRKDGR